MKHTRQDLKIMQGWSLERKIRVTQTRIMEWYMRYDGQVFISFSGGKDSTVLLDLARRVYPDIPAVYVDTGLEYPELRDFVKTKDNVIWLRPRYPFTQILEKYGYPIISKEVSDVINGARKGQPYRLARLNGELLDKNGKKSIYNCENYKYLLDAPFKISARCCYHMKKAPLNKFERQSGRHPITGVLACESKLREQSWIKFGCNGFERQRPLSQPLAFWLEEDILRYLKMTGIPYAPIYGDIVESRKKNGTPILKTTGVSRSGCMYCMYGVHLEHEPNRFQLMQRYVVKAPVYEQPATQREKAPEPDEIIPYRWNARNIRIAVAGSQRRSGVTVTAFNLASWLAARGAEVAYIEVNQNRHLQLLLNIYEAAPDGEHYTIDGIDCYLTNEPDKAYQFIIYDCGVMQTPTSIFRDADHRLLCGSVLPYEIPVFHKALSECGSLEVRPVAICVPQEIQEYCMELFGENVQIAAASHDLFAKRVNGQIYRPLVEKYIAGEKRL